MTEAQIKHMVERFLGWKLPKPWNPDNGIGYKRPNYMHAPADHDWPTGTNLFDYNQAKDMVRYMLEGAPTDDAELLWQAYTGLHVLSTVFKRHGIDGGYRRANEILRDIEKVHPEFPAKSALRKP